MQKPGAAPLEAGTGVASADAPTTPRRAKKPLSFHMSFLALNIMVFIVSLDATVLAVAIPEIARQLHSTTLQAFWASISFMLAVVVTQPLYTSTSDVLGRKLPLYTSFVLFIAGSIIFAVAQDMTVLIVGRILQGLGAGGIDVLGEIIVADMTTLKERPLYLGLLAIPMLAGSVLGPTIGALFSQRASWRWIGWINLPIAAVGLVLVFFFLHLRPLQASFTSKLRRLDWTGMGLFTVGSTAFVLPLSWAGAMYAWGDWRTLLPLLIGVAVIAVFGYYESRPAEPVMPHRLFNSATAAVSLTGAFIHGMVVYCLMLYLPLFFQSTMMETPLQSVVSLLPLSIVSVVFAFLSAASVNYLRKYRWNIWSGWVFQCVGLGLLSLLGPSASTAVKVVSQVIAGIGIGALYFVLVLPMQASAPVVDDAGLAAGLLISFRLFGALIGLSVGSTVFSSTWDKTIADLGALPEVLEPFRSGKAAVELIPVLRTLELPREVLAPLLDVYTKSLRTIWYVLVGFSLFGLATSVLTKEITLDKEEMGRQRFEEESS
ncbi:major facilitator superfamily domain-containing protein [Podospora aff. communis PSN243]|uniref:Major facilitator superfamily domain-containing protein n=1 Tax=Podospora aff. communis PSN243 TaxID=3040156 RepID=A0AAV9GS49_9PEZI|nr:major facilitator superfamily domain-containing protein [Podospora aff. communis PSN243]